MPCCSASRTLACGGAADAMRDLRRAARSLSAGVSLKLRIAIRAIDSPSRGRPMRAAGCDSSAITGAATGS